MHFQTLCSTTLTGDGADLWLPSRLFRSQACSLPGREQSFDRVGGHDPVTHLWSSSEMTVCFPIDLKSTHLRNHAFFRTSRILTFTWQDMIYSSLIRSRHLNTWKEISLTMVIEIPWWFKEFYYFFSQSWIFLPILYHQIQMNRIVSNNSASHVAYSQSMQCSPRKYTRPIHMGIRTISSIRQQSHVKRMVCYRELYSRIWVSVAVEQMGL